MCTYVKLEWKQGPIDDVHGACVKKQVTVFDGKTYGYGGSGGGGEEYGMTDRQYLPGAAALPRPLESAFVQDTIGRYGTFYSFPGSDDSSDDLV